MYLDKDIFKSEVSLKENECCVVFDFRCFFPYIDYENLTFNFKLGSEIIDDYKVNTRYPNKCLKTITKKYGKKLSKIGYPYIMNLDNETDKLCLLEINVGIKDKVMHLIFPLQFKFTKENRIAKVCFQFDFENPKFYFYTNDVMYVNSEPEDEFKNDYFVLRSPERLNNMLIYNDVIVSNGIKIDC